MPATWRVLEGDCRTSMAELAAGSVQTCVTSPPYFGLRDYGHDGQIGLEPSSAEFVEALVDVFREVRRVLRDDGTVWLNLGDSYAGSQMSGGGKSSSTLVGTHHEEREGARFSSPPRAAKGCKPKDLIGIPWMVAFALRADGWYLRSEIIWHKPNPMPESVTDRPTKAHEQLFLLAKSPRYFYDAEAVKEDGAYQARAMGCDGDLSTRNKRSVWTVASQPFAGAHFATFPPNLILPCVLAGSGEKACSVCGSPWRRMVERTPMVTQASDRREGMQGDQGGRARTQTGGTMVDAPTSRTVGFQMACECPNAGTVPGVVLDPFAGAGTTGVVALRNGRSFVGCELNPDYAQMARYRIVDDAPLLNGPAEIRDAS